MKRDNAKRSSDKETKRKSLGDHTRLLEPTIAIQMVWSSRQTCWKKQVDYPIKKGVFHPGKRSQKPYQYVQKFYTTIDISGLIYNNKYG